MTRLKVLFVCTGNICRSPTAEGVARRVAQERGMEHLFEFDSAGTHDYHAGEPPDPRTIAAARRRGYDLSRLRARKVVAADFAHFDHVLAMGRDHLDWLVNLCPPPHRGKLGLFLDFSRHAGEDDVPDPYYGGAQGFDQVLDLIEDAATRLVLKLGGK